ncbi:MAG: amidohydrolase [Betaproteobacteria bacterium RIFCSPLOWO2_12_FULL_62_58]|nr:MAG: amidohydrolase [Betaproteobacteria bacterium RIFCSPLOWO2_02_FULL_62_79]OGA50875.1 MAG: amidohydrolase [Betaproteobacteria bacterium RIFCSPLOWO2_12_FULL_62_58]
MSAPFRLACLQLNSGNDLQANLAAVRLMTCEAAGNGAQFVLTPEYALMMDGSGRVMRERALGVDGAPALGALQSLAREHGVWFLAGSLTVRTDEERIANRSFLISADGHVVATYDKIHMFDVTLPDGKVIRESSAYRSGDRAMVAETPWGRLGMTVCYDLRFPGLFRTLAQAGAQFITVPSSFQRQTGKVHWHTLLKARAIENECFIIAPAMCGDHSGNRQSYGHTLVIDPWGEILAEGGEAPEIVYADIDPARVEKVRGMIPSLEHDREFQPPRAG